MTEMSNDRKCVYIEYDNQKADTPDGIKKNPERDELYESYYNNIEEEEIGDDMLDNPLSNNSDDEDDQKKSWKEGLLKRNSRNSSLEDSLSGDDSDNKRDL
ncbi:uncharacterized protein BT62DRAFT_919548 [Guyanagaster necrorhizus]|uniref:Uncharacterized protein n=1 Tax=Guyanagaster necrorhizus TaxID=856835 RepID=A0A9P7VUZ6_9AGAR|nr:uncharacterized protein BT62DRAFT_919548 [Guyanagaster necrorhizus MCA 3950]KAG7447057.1 hypothetical protein BT62DRAFT_919548 [Guyanagaster necrorhizus MCA 3950]